MAGKDGAGAGARIRRSQAKLEGFARGQEAEP
jgi:hypothetical protein